MATVEPNQAVSLRPQRNQSEAVSILGEALLAIDMVGCRWPLLNLVSRGSPNRGLDLAIAQGPVGALRGGHPLA